MNFFKIFTLIGIRMPEEASSPSSLLHSPSSLFRKSFSKTSPVKQRKGKQKNKTFKSFSGVLVCIGLVWVGNKIRFILAWAGFEISWSQLRSTLYSSHHLEAHPIITFKLNTFKWYLIFSSWSHWTWTMLTAADSVQYSDNPSNPPPLPSILSQGVQVNPYTGCLV